MLNEKEPNDYGVYSIECLPTNSIYIGETNNIKRRWSEHLETLISNTHYNHSLQNDFNKYGKDAFVFQVLNRIDGELLMLNKAKCLVLEHAYIKYYKSLFNVYNIKDTMNDYLLYDSIIVEKDANSINPIRKQILNVLSNYICVKDGLSLNIKYVGSLKRQLIINGIIPEDGLAYWKIIKKFPKEILDTSIYKRCINYLRQKNQCIEILDLFLVVKKNIFNEYIYSNYDSFTSENILFPSATKLRKILLSENMISGKMTAAIFKKILTDNNIFISKSNEATEFALKSKYVEYCRRNSCYVFTPQGLKYIIPIILRNKWSMVDYE